jgi:hypothetical protein
VRHALAGSVVLVVTLPLLACSPSSPTAPSSAPTPAPTTDSAAATAPASKSPESGSPTPTTLATLAATDCLTGPYRLVRFAQLGGTATYGSGQGGDVEVSFTGKRYTLRGGGQDPVALALAGQTADLTIDGTAKGTFDLKGARATFDLGDATGSAVLKTGGHRQKLTMDQVAAVVAPDGPAQVACTSEAMTLTFSDVRLELARPVR